MSGENNNIVTKTGANNWMGTICENELDKSIEEHKWKIKLLNVTGNDLMFFSSYSLLLLFHHSLYLNLIVY